MPMNAPARRVLALPAALVAALLATPLVLTALPAAARNAADAPPAEAAPDRTGQVRRGQASVSSAGLSGQRMADGGRFAARSNVVASTDLPLGTTARVTNLRNRRTAIVQVRDRLPARGGDRILNVSPQVARELGMRANGVAQVEVAPLAVPQADGGVRIGQGSGMAGRRAYITRPPS